MLTLSLVLGGSEVAEATTVNLVTNGGFELGGVSTWAHFVGGSGDWLTQSGTHNPLTGTVTVPAPPAGLFAAMTDAFSPGEHVLYQIIHVPSVVLSATLQFDRYINNATNHSGPFVSPATLFYGGAPNQQARVDFLKSASIPDSVASSDVLLNVFQTAPGDPLISGYTLQTTDVTALLAAHVNENMLLRFAETDNLGIFYFGIDQVSLIVTVPEPGSLTLAVVGLFAWATCWLRRRPSALR
jgi:hypothetical protein